MTLIEKTAYLKGLLDGMNKEDKVISLMAEILHDISLELEDHQDQLDEICEAVDAVTDDMEELEDELFGDDDDNDDFDDYDDIYGDDEEDEALFEAVCPTCGDTVIIDEKMLEAGSVNCHNCGELLEFDLDDIEDDEE